MSEGDLDSSIQDYMLFGSGFLPEPSMTENRDKHIECVPQQDEISGHDPLCPKMVISSKCIHHQTEQCSDSGTYCNPHCITTYDKSIMQISPVRKVRSEVHTISSENYGSSSLPEFRNNEAMNVNSIFLKKRKFDAASESTNRQERHLMIEGDHSNETRTFSLRTGKYEHFGKTVECSLKKEYNETKKFISNLSQNPCEKGVLISEFELGSTRETIQALEKDSFNINSNLHPEIENEVEPQSSNPFYTCQAQLQNGDQLTTNDDFETCVGLSSITTEVENKITPEDMKKSNDASKIPPERKEDSIFSQDDSPYFHDLLISHDNEECENNDSITHWSSLNDGKTYNHVSANVTDAASSMECSSLNADSLYDDDLEQDLDNSVADNVDDVTAVSDSEACDKVRTQEITKDNTVTVDAVRTLVKGGTDENSRNLDLTNKYQDDKEMINISYSLNKTEERLEDSLLEANTNNGLHSDKSTASDVSAENTQVKELSDNYEMSIVNEDYVQLFNRHEKQINRSSVDLQGQNVFSDPNSLVNLRACHPNLPGISLIYGLCDDIRNIRIESSQTHQYAGNDNEYGPEHRVNANVLGSLNVVPGQAVQLQEINYTYPQHENGYTLDNYNLPSAPQNGIHFQQGTNRHLVGDTERSMEGPFESNAEVQRNDRSEESIIYRHANEFRDVRVETFNTHHRENDLPVNDNEPSHSDHDLFGGPDKSGCHQTHGIESICSTAHQHSLENSSVFPHNEKTWEIIPSTEVTHPVHRDNSFLSRQNETPEILGADSSYRASDISRAISVPVQEAISRSSSYESLHRVQERSFVFRQTSCPSTESETNSISFDESLQRDFEYALELQQQLNHEFFMEDEALARRLDNSQRQTLSPPGYGSRRTEFFGPRAEDMINLNPRRRQQRQQHGNRHPGRHRRETAASRDGQSNRELGLEDMVSLHENNSGHSVHSHETSQGNLQGVMQQSGAVAGANVADSRVPFDSDFQSVRQSSGRATIRNRSVPHRFEPDPVERVERIPGQSAQIDPSVITPLSRNYQEERRQLEEQRRQLEARHWQHQHHYRQQNWRTGLDLLPNEDYPSLDVHSSYYDPDEVFEIEDGEQYVSITQDPFILRRFLRSRRPTFEMPDQDSYNELWNLVEMLGEVRQQGLNQTHIEMLPVHTFDEGNSGESKECNICLSAYSNGDEIRTLTCLHMFHTACIDEWLNRNAACPVCRRRIEIEDS